MRASLKVGAFLLGLVASTFESTIRAEVPAQAQGVIVAIPVVCSRGPSGQRLHTRVTVPATAAVGSTYRVRLDSIPSGRISNTGLYYLRDMASDYVVPPGASYVEGSARIVPGTGSENVRAGARAWYEAGLVHMLLPAHVENGSSYTPPSVEFEVKVNAPAGTRLEVKFARHRLVANVFLLGALRVTCDPTPKPYTLATTLATP